MKETRLKRFLIPAIISLLLFFSSLLLFSCDSENIESPSRTTLSINNMSSYDLYDVEYASVEFGVVISGRDATMDVTSGTRYVFFSLLINNQLLRCRTVNVLTVTEDLSNEITFTDNTLVIEMTGEYSSNLRNVFETMGMDTTFTINNMSDYTIYSVEYSSTIFGTIISGRDSTFGIVATSNNVFFNIQSPDGMIRCRTELITTLERTANTYTITNNTVITEVVSGNTGTLQNIYNNLHRPNKPAVPELLASDQAIRVSWAVVDEAASYRVFYSTNPSPPSTPDITTTDTTVFITGLTNDIVYYIWIQAVNINGASELSDITQAVPTNNFTVNTMETFLNALNSINSASDGDYTITVTGSFSSLPVIFESGTSKRIAIIGNNVSQTINNDGATDLITISSGIILEIGNNITLNGNNKNANVVNVQAGGTFIMNNGSTVTGAQRTNSTSNPLNSSGVMSAGTFTMNGGTITGNDNTNRRYQGGGYFGYEGGGVRIVSGTFTMNGGIISNNQAFYGGGVSISNSTFILNDGNISENSAYDGGGVTINNSTFSMYDGVINNNNADYWGGGVDIVNSTFNMRGGVIRNNTADSGGGISNEGNVIMDNGIIINNITSGSGGGINCSGNFTMNGGEIINNFSNTAYNAQRGGGGVFLNNGTFLMNNGLISGNFTTSRGGGVMVTNSGFFHKTGGIIDALNSTSVDERGRVAFVFISASNLRRRETAAGATVNLNSSVAGSAGGWE